MNVEDEASTARGQFEERAAAQREGGLAALRNPRDPPDHVHPEHMQ